MLYFNLLDFEEKTGSAALYMILRFLISLHTTYPPMRCDEQGKEST
jgi:hypothetical protein